MVIKILNQQMTALGLNRLFLHAFLLFVLNIPKTGERLWRLVAQLGSHNENILQALRETKNKTL